MTQDAPHPGRAAVGATADAGWAGELAARLFDPPGRWGWRYTEVPEPAELPAFDLDDPPEWVDPPRPDNTELRYDRQAALWRVVGRVLVAAAVTGAFVVTRVRVERYFHEHGWKPDSFRVFQIGVGLVLLVLVLAALQHLAAFVVVAHRLRAFERPYRQMREIERRRHEQAVSAWQRAAHDHAVSRAEARAHHESAALWHPVGPAGPAVRVDAVGGDPHRHGWASLLVTAGTSALAAGERVAVLDLTGRDVGGGLLSVAAAFGRRVRRVDLPADGARVELFAGMAPDAVAECLGYALTVGSGVDEERDERTLAVDLVRGVAGCLGAEVTLGRLAAGAQVLRRSAAEAVLSPEEVTRLADLVGEFGRTEWSAKHVQLVASRLGVLAGALPDGGGGGRLWCPEDVTVVATGGGRGDRKDLADRLVANLTQFEMHRGGRFADLLVVAGADRLGVGGLARLSDHALAAGVRLMVMIDQPQGGWEAGLGTGGAVCVMKMFNHQDAEIAAQFIGREHRFVLSQLTRQAGRSFTESGGDSFGVSTGRGSEGPPSVWEPRGPVVGVSESRGHAWTGVRNWSAGQQFGRGSTLARSYEFAVEPREILGMPETAFILVDSSGAGRRVVMADSNPGISLSGRTG
jgi:hypothetical protein